MSRYGFPDNRQRMSIYCPPCKTTRSHVGDASHNSKIYTCRECGHQRELPHGFARKTEGFVQVEEGKCQKCEKTDKVRTFFQGKKICGECLTLEVRMKPVLPF